MAAALIMLDEKHTPLPTHPGDNNTYKLGRIKQHNVVIACLPSNQYGNVNAANVVTNLTRTFPSIRAGLLVGIGGGVPSKANDIRLGDIVVGSRVVQYDLGKTVGDGELQTTASPRFPHQLLSTAVSALRAEHEQSSSQISYILNQRLEDHPAYCRPKLPDRLFDTNYDHELIYQDCDQCDQSSLVQRGKRPSSDIAIHYGPIASANQVMKSGPTRDNLAQQLKVICFEMEAAGLMDTLPCLIIRGICDYSDSHKSKGWQRYAAATAAAYARELLGELSMTENECNRNPASSFEHNTGELMFRFIQVIAYGS
jgi:nucleoside phosphorylase